MSDLQLDDVSHISNGSSHSDMIEKVLDDTTNIGSLENDFQDALDRLDNVKLDANLDISELPPDENENSDPSPDSSSLGRGSISSGTSGKISNSSESEASPSNKKTEPKSEEKRKSVDAGATASKGQKLGSSVFAKLRRMTKSDKKSRKVKTSSFEEVKVDKLPQVFIAKYLGKKDAKGLSGLHNVRRPVDKLVGSVKKELEEKDIVELPLVYVVISTKGIDIREHKANKVKDVVPSGLIPIDFVSYGVQDMKFWRVFTFIAIKELSSRSKTMECHAIMCDKPENARKMALSLGAAFSVYKKKLSTEGKSHNFQVELRAPDELAAAYQVEDEDC